MTSGGKWDSCPPPAPGHEARAKRIESNLPACSIYLGLSFRMRANFFFLVARCFLTAALARAIVVGRKWIFF